MRICIINYPVLLQIQRFYVWYCAINMKAMDDPV
jgi:hypothetical protein